MVIATIEAKSSVKKYIAYIANNICKNTEIVLNACFFVYLKIEKCYTRK